MNLTPGDLEAVLLSLKVATAAGRFAGHGLLDAEAVSTGWWPAASGANRPDLEPTPRVRP